MLEWCASGENIEDYSQGPSLCFTITAFIIPINIVFFTLMMIRLRRITTMIEFDYIDQQIKMQASLLSGGCVCMGILSLVLGITTHPSVSIGFYILTEVCTWLLAGILVKLEAYRLVKWPSTTLWAYFTLHCMLQIIMAATRVKDSVIAERVCAFLLALIALFLVVFSLFCAGGMWGSGDQGRGEVYRQSLEFNTTSPVRSSQSSSSLPFFWLRPPSNRSMKVYEKKTSWWGGGGGGGGAVDHYPLLSDDEEEQGRRPAGQSGPRSWFSFLFPSASAAAAGGDPEGEFEVRRGAAGGEGGAGLGGDEEEMRSVAGLRDSMMSDSSFDPHSLSFSSNSQSLSMSSTSSSSRALQQVFSAHKLKVSSGLPPLEPKGRLASGAKGGGMGVDGGLSPRFNSLWAVTVQKWGTRGDGEDVEIEFEIEVTLKLPSPSSPSSSLDAPLLTGSGKRSAANRVVVWRTAEEVMKLHSVLVSFMGDDAPRRPRLKSVSTGVGGEAGLGSADLSMDMRSLTLYFASILKMPQHPPLSPIQDFFNLPPLLKLIPSNTHAASGASSGVGARGRGRGEIEVMAEDGEDITTTRSSLLDANPRLSMQQTHAPGSAAAPRGQDKWRKLFMLMRISLKPKDIGVRCRLFEGVISGEDVARWLMRTSTNAQNQNSHNSAPSSTSQPPAAASAAASSGQEDERQQAAAAAAAGGEGEEGGAPSSSIVVDEPEGSASASSSAATSPVPAHANTNTNTNASNANAGGYSPCYARDLSEAQAIGQDLLSCGLIIPVCAGYVDDEDHDDALARGAGAAEGEDEQSGSRFFTFSTLPAYIYRFPGKSGTAGGWTLIGSVLSVKIPHMTLWGEGEGVKNTRDTLGFIVSSANVILNEEIAESGGGMGVGGEGTGKGVVRYFIDVTHGGDNWQVSRRYREFEQLHKSLVKEGVRPPAPLPPKSMVKNFVGGARGPTIDDNRRLGLETYITGVVQAVVDMCGDDGVKGGVGAAAGGASEGATAGQRALLLVARFLDEDFDNLLIFNEA